MSPGQLHQSKSRGPPDSTVGLLVSLACKTRFPKFELRLSDGPAANVSHRGSSDGAPWRLAAIQRGLCVCLNTSEGLDAAEAERMLGGHWPLVGGVYW